MKFREKIMGLSLIVAIAATNRTNVQASAYEF